MTDNQTEISDIVLKRFVLLEGKGCLAHAYLFIGPAGIGKAATALAVAKFLICGNKGANGSAYFCDRCPSCVKINSGNHPDVHVTESVYGETIKIDQVRELLSQIKLRPFMAEKKIFIMHNIENLTLEGANALLKTLEEPSVNSLLLLTTSVPERNLDTVKSRCHAVHFSPSSYAGLAEKISGHPGGKDLGARFLSYFSEGCLGKARGLKENGLLKRRDDIVDRFILGGGRDVFTKKILSDKQKTKEFLDILLSWVRDCFLLKVGVGDGRLVHAGRMKDIRDFQRRYSFEELKALNDEIIRTCRMLADNLNVKIPLAVIGEMLWADSYKSN